MYILFIADTHDGLDPADIKACVGRLDPDYIIGLGDISLNDYLLLRELYPIKVIGGILGNHDGKNLFNVLERNKCRVVDLNQRIFTIDDVNFIGLSGSLKYKDNDAYAFLTQDECSAILKNAPKADVILTHDKPADDSVEFDPHGGLIGIRDYIYEKEPAYNIHGHLHEQYVHDIGKTKEICIYKYALCEVNNYGRTSVRIINQI